MAKLWEKVPQQLNGSDCGFYALHFAKVFINDAKKCRDLILV
jgi:Ulp1 family protease